MRNAFGLILDEKQWIARTNHAHRKYSCRSRVRFVYYRKQDRIIWTRPSHVKNRLGRAPAGIMQIWGGFGVTRAGAMAVHLWRKQPKLSSLNYARHVIAAVRDKDLVPHVCGDNHRTHTSAHTRDALAAARIRHTFIPPRSPDLSPMDFSMWSEIIRRMTRQERSWPASHRETIPQWMERLRRTAQRLPEVFLRKVYTKWRRRMRACLSVRGAVFGDV
jgi:hypothetical protein